MPFLKIVTLTIFDRDANPNANDLIDDPGAPGVATYSYDPASPQGLRRAGGQNRRIRKVVAGGDTYDYYYNESWQVLEVQKAGRTNKTYQQSVWGIQYVDAPVVQFRDTADDGTLDETLYYTYDGNFNVTAVIKPDGTVAERYTYDPYGQVTFKAADWSDAASQAKSAYDNEILYCGYRWDPESGNYIARRRYLTPPLGRWLTTDPIVYGDGMNWYQYCHSKPVVLTDSDGRLTGYVLAAIAVATYVCGSPFQDEAHERYENRTDKFRHCWVSCKMSRWCGGMIAQMGGLGKEAKDSALRIINEMDGGTGDWGDSFWDLVANNRCMGCESFLGLPGAWIGAIFRESCECCCNRYYK